MADTKCPKCRGEKIKKDGFYKGGQMFRCQNCNLRYSIKIANNYKEKSQKQLKVISDVIIIGLSIQAAAIRNNTSKSTVQYWVKNRKRIVEKILA